MQTVGRSICVLAVALTVTAVIAFPGLTANDGDIASRNVVAGPSLGKSGSWRAKIQQIFDQTARTLSQRRYVIWDTEPHRDLDFSWTPDNPPSDKPGRINGIGHLIWRTKDKPPYDPSSVFAEYYGSVRNGRIDGSGHYRDHTGLTYQGQWKDGQMDGVGTLTLPTQDEYVGQFRESKANGLGRYIDVTGEIYEGPFVDGRRNGHATTILPNRHAYSSDWIAGHETEGSRLVRIAQSGGITLAGVADDVRIGVAVARDPALASEDGKWHLLYKASNNAAAVIIQPASSLLLGRWKEKKQLQLTWTEQAQIDNGMFSNGVLGFSEKYLAPLNLRIEVENRSLSTAHIAGIYLDVESSITQTKPAIQVTVKPPMGSPDDVRVIGCEGDVGYGPVLNINNFGWGAAEHAELHLKLPETAASKSSFDIVKTLGDVDRNVEVDLEPDLKAAGIDTEYLRSNEGLICRSKEMRQCLQQLKATGKFGALSNFIELQDVAFSKTVVIKLVSELAYSWRDAGGNSTTWTHPFTATVPLGHLKALTECGEMGGVEVVSLNTQQLHLDDKDYRLPISFRTDIAPGKISPLVLTLGATKSSEHAFAVVVQLTDGREIRSRPVNLVYYRPSWFENFESAETPTPSSPHRAMEKHSNKTFPISNAYLIGTNGSFEYCEQHCLKEDKCAGFTLQKSSHDCYFFEGDLPAYSSDLNADSGVKGQISK